ncbi:hypothetical protein ASPZODRAFT_130840 [Penicilliopsis zonata CBS 506.65]|uniref:Alpha/beta hydrolase fold-3 domain-containing protein n=1 Tax=Penicilliopsis zonata CBS 506.65 TaxID=1073090 RepID=A0A1L9SNN7_9EURO|nr:hypothetical protein ASPZODRAFT_130840 [Penicilliopsis zonata CBS 506.65]OJJ48723.1 hypothetical protein ASPZODRAFT_130840 [Penicilliopsis zonata CBS 506.65]
MAESYSSEDKLAGFDLMQTNYKTVDEHAIRADLIIPQKAGSGKRPVIVHFHGGGLVTGDSLFMDWVPRWLLELAKRYGAVIVSPNYRLLPEVTSLDLFADVDDFWTWLHSSTPATVLAAHSTPTELDLDRVLMAGGSAGGLLSISLALSHPDEVRAATAAYPMIDLNSADYNEKRAVPPLGTDVSESVVRKYLAAVEDGSSPVISSAMLPTRIDLMIGLFTHAMYKEEVYERGIEGSGSPRREVRYPFERLDQPGVKVPRGGIVILHGRQDSVVPIGGSERFVTKARKVFAGQPGGDRIVLAAREGEHGFDTDVAWDTNWVKEALEAAVQAWLE